MKRSIVLATEFYDKKNPYKIVFLKKLQQFSLNKSADLITSDLFGFYFNRLKTHL